MIDEKGMKTGGIKIKICGIAREEDARLAVELGADFLGFIFCASPRRINPLDAYRIMRDLPSSTARVGVFMNQTLEEVREIERCCCLDYLQFHGQEGPEYYRGFNRRAIKSVRVSSPRDLQELDRWETEMVLLDAAVSGVAGGTGRSFPWEWAGGREKDFPRIILAGGLNHHNAALAIEQAKPYAVDVSSGVESAPGKKDFYKLSAFIAAVRQAEKRCA